MALLSQVESTIEHWKKKLLDTTKRNRLLYFKHSKSGRSVVQIVEPAWNNIFAWLVSGNKKLVFSQDIDDQLELQLDSATQIEPTPNKTPNLALGEIRTDLSDQQLAATLYNIRSRSRTSLEEQGVNILYMAFGMLEWYEAESSDELIHSPLVLVPVTLTRQSITKPYVIEPIDEDIILNPTVVFRMQSDFNLSLVPLPEDWETTTLIDVLTGIREAIRGQRRWSVSPEVHLGLFSFEKLVMLKDIETHIAEALLHPIINALAGDRSMLLEPPEDIPVAGQLDERIQPKETFQVLDADSSQQEAIAAAIMGVNIVIQGPPGTGKSQTIANMIAEFLARDKKVLFVSAKIAALDVVKKRLEECGLADFCLEAHGHKAKKGLVIDQLARSINTTYQIENPIFESELRNLVGLRAKLNDYVKALHTTSTALQQSAFNVHGQLAKLHSARDLVFPLKDVASVDSDELNRMVNVLEELISLGDVWDRFNAHPWRGTLLTDYTFQAEADIEAHFTNFIDSIKEFRSRVQELTLLLNIPTPTNLTEAEIFGDYLPFVLKTPNPPAMWFRSVNLASLRESAQEALEFHQVHNNSLKKLLAICDESIISADDMPQILERFGKSYRNILRWLNPQFKNDLKRIQDFTLRHHKPRYGEARDILKFTNDVRVAKDWFQANAKHHREQFDKYYRGLDSDWQLILSALEWTQSLVLNFPWKPIADEFINVIANDPGRIAAARVIEQSLANAFKRIREEKTFFATIFPIDHVRIDEQRFDYSDFSVLIDRIKFRLEHLSELERWIAFENVRESCTREGIGPYVEFALKAQIKSEDLVRTFLKRFYKVWLDVVYSEHPVLKFFDVKHHSKELERFRQLDIRQLTIARKRVIAKLLSLRPQSQRVDAPSSEIVILRREVAKKKRHKPIRRLFSEIPNLLLRLKPCLMMSPLSVSQFLSLGNFSFDVVIFDEASQLPPEDTLGSIMRGSQVIVAGDHNQLPPTTFFKSLGTDDGDWEEESPHEVLESILQECWTFLPRRPLDWHYRSRHESLIAFSNYHFYENRLITFPNPSINNEDAGIELISVSDGVYDRSKSRTNRIEARRVAALIIEHFSKCPERSLGVVAFSDAQRQAIEQELIQLIRGAPELEYILNQGGLDGFFVKNLENVQGDERDVMLFSIGYGRDINGKMFMNFGPLNGEDGARRLNTAITRARYHVKLVSSILPEDIDSAFKNRGVQLLRSYLEYARQRGNIRVLYSETGSDPLSEIESPFELSVHEALTTGGLILHKQVGCSGYRIDFGVVDPNFPGRYLLGIECDGATYHSAKTVRDRDRLRQQVLEGLGWKIHRIWSRDWIQDPKSQLESVFAAVEESKKNIDHRKAPPDNSKLQLIPDKIEQSKLISVNSVDTQTDSTAQPEFPGVQTYAYARLTKQGTARGFYYGDSSRIQDMLIALVNKEGPIHVAYASRRLAECWGISRAGTKVQRIIRNEAKKLAQMKELKLRGDFLWPFEKITSIVRRPPPQEEPRPIAEIALEEIAGAAYLCLEDALSLTREDLVSQTARLLGFDRTGDKVSSRITEAIEQSVRKGRMCISNGKVNLQAKVLRT